MFPIHLMTHHYYVLRHRSLLLNDTSSDLSSSACIKFHPFVQVPARPLLLPILRSMGLTATVEAALTHFCLICPNKTASTHNSSTTTFYARRSAATSFNCGGLNPCRESLGKGRLEFDQMASAP